MGYFKRAKHTFLRTTDVTKHTQPCTHVLKKNRQGFTYIESIQRSYIREIIHLSLLNIDAHAEFYAEHGAMDVNWIRNFYNVNV